MGVVGPDHPRTTLHIAQAIASYPRWALLTYSRGRGNRQWYNGTEECPNDPIVRAGKACDEYPFYTTVEGGPFAARRPSLKLVPAVESQPQATNLSAFYRACRLRPDDPIDGRFVVVPWPTVKRYTCKR